jgi:hypothetical protein
MKEKEESVKHDDFKKLHEKNKMRVMDLLTPEQKEMWKTLAGPEFKGELHFTGK